MLSESGHILTRYRDTLNSDLSTNTKSRLTVKYVCFCWCKDNKDSWEL